ncbi:LysR family transcriptional regulator [Pseudoroseomonas ludipueritiae]|uniref:LysR family transcriptional regulator n=1 Tax=Pseudoroseomonas ludipueritiae TaxID=198093 RepID=A0ABR7R648_9PROT|nr:LysR substrate-binding domain-containing protein [Pseudoroseomonas ludipueritiae]MBC9177206.1 LysR family transcriptional regulator [Pseudoroseomonas ludipueritiae]MCG7363088.1 LysR substrate-binding domain-containing protein [Roseomonas sp. ACRSG]
MRIPDLDLDLLRCFVQVAERGGFTPGALALGLTQSAVSLKVKRLEDLVGRRVFERTSRSVALTRDGETLLAYARRMLALNDEAVRRLVAPPVTGRLRLGVADHFVPRNLAPILARFARDFPDVRLEVEVGRSHELRAAQERGALDLVLGKRRDGETTGSILWTEPIVWVAAPGWVAPEGRPLPLAMLPQGCMFRDRALAALARAGMGFEVVYTSASLLGVAAAAQAGLAATVMGRSGLPPGLRETDGLPPLGVAEMAVFGDAAGRTQLVAPLVALIRDSLEQN